MDILRIQAWHDTSRIHARAMEVDVAVRAGLTARPWGGGGSARNRWHRTFWLCLPCKANVVAFRWSKPMASMTGLSRTLSGRYPRNSSLSCHLC